MINGFLRHCSRPGHHIVRFFDINKSAGGDLRSGQELAAAGFEGEGNDHDAVLGQMLAVAKHDVSDIADSDPVYQDIAHLDLFTDNGSVFSELQDITGMQDKNILFVIPQTSQELRLGLEVPVLSVNGDAVSGLHEVVDQLYVLLAGMAGGMDILGNDVRALVGPIVTLRCRPSAMRLRAAILSPWLPVVMMTVFSPG